MGVTNPRSGDGTQRRLRLLLVAILGVAIGLGLYVAAFAHTSTAGSTGPVSGDLARVHSSRRAVRILFVGNSFTAANGMTGMITRLAADAPGSTCPVLAVQYTPGGSTLADALNDRRVTHLIRSERWDAVVLQDQSQLPSLPDWRASEMLPSVGRLDGLIRADGALPMLSARARAQSVPEPLEQRRQAPQPARVLLAAATLRQELATRLDPLDCHLSTRQSSFTAGLAGLQADALQRYGESAVAHDGTPGPASR